MTIRELQYAIQHAIDEVPGIPDSAEVKDTISQIEKAMEAAKTNTAAKASAPAKTEPTKK